MKQAYTAIEEYRLIKKRAELNSSLFCCPESDFSSGLSHRGHKVIAYALLLAKMSITHLTQ